MHGREQPPFKFQNPKHSDYKKLMLTVEWGEVYLNIFGALGMKSGQNLQSEMTTFN